MTYTSEDTNLNDFLYCNEELGERPSKVVLAFNFKAKEFKEFIDGTINKVINTLIEIIPDKDESIVNEKSFLKIEDKFFLSYTHMDKAMVSGFVSNVIFYHKIEDLKIIDSYLEQLNNFVVEIEEVKTKLSYVSNSTSGLILEPMDLMIADYENIELYFNDSTLKQTKKLIKKINKTEKGISIIYGKRGTGKTTMLNHIVDGLDKNSIFIPISMVDSTINNPTFKTVLEADSVIIIDDCEILNSDLYGKSSLTFANILQMVDGFFSDEIAVNIILSFNVENEDDIDEEILESNNLIDIIKIEELKKSKAIDLGKHLKIKNKIDTPLLLIDILKERFDVTPINIGYQ
jgi:tRNA A37 threonylcarbamoyladenosine biosynthesis protein TsaE